MTEPITVQQAWAWLLAGAVALVSIAKAWEIVRKLARPDADKVREHTEMLDRDNRRINALERRLDESDEYNAQICQALLALINHELSGNGVESLRESRDELQKYLTTRTGRHV